jgi:hypothetical protein
VSVLEVELFQTTIKSSGDLEMGLTWCVVHPYIWQLFSASFCDFCSLFFVNEPARLQAESS